MGGKSSQRIGSAGLRGVFRVDRAEYGCEPVHGGLECGAFFEKNPDLDMIAIGPSLTDVHSPDESCDIESIRVTAELVIRILEKLA